MPNPSWDIRYLQYGARNNTWETASLLGFEHLLSDR